MGNKVTGRTVKSLDKDGYPNIHGRRVGWETEKKRGGTVTFLK